jgi:CDP-glycerol glycerophosphotransferase (TagB/SpsB family)
VHPGLNKNNHPKELLLLLLSFAIWLLARISDLFNKEKIWMITCGGDRWGDNSDALWRYLCLHHPEVKAYAVVRNIDDIAPANFYAVKRNSLLNFILILRAEVLATTHTLYDFAPRKILNLSNAKKVWLQHGVVAIGKISGDTARSSNFDLVCVSSQREKELMINELGMNSAALSLTGLARHDVLLSKIRNELFREGVLYVPTSRMWSVKGMKDAYEKVFFSWIEDLNELDPKISVKMWLHPGWSKIGIGDLGLNYDNMAWNSFKHDPQQILCESNILITDYSSIFFDAALSSIPTIFYQPDRADYIKNKGLFKGFLQQDFLLIAKDTKELISKIVQLSNDSVYYQERVEKDQAWANKYVERFDGLSCERIYRQIDQILNSSIF